MPIDNGTKIGRYEIRSLLGVGGMGEVYLAFDTKLERNVAIKLLTKSSNKEHLQRFKLEAKAIIALNHPHILSIYEFGQHAGLHYIVMEYLQGKTLRDKIKEDKLGLSDALEIVIQIANALSAAHLAGIVHRDIKPENIMVLPDGYIKVLDFGLAKITGLFKQITENPELSTMSLFQTKAGLILGTVNYMSPEQLRGQPIDEQTDIWSLGVVLFEITGNQRPFLGESIGDIIASVLEHPLPAISQIKPGIPLEIESIIARSLQKDKSMRYQTAQEMAADLKNAKIHIDSGHVLLSGKTLEQNQLQAIENTHEILYEYDGAGKLENNPASLTNTHLKTDLRTVAIQSSSIGWILALVFLFSLIAAGFYIYQNISQTVVRKDWKPRRLATNGNVANAVISPDGRFIAYVQKDSGKESLWLKQVSETADQELIAPEELSYSKLTFAPDGNSIYFVVFGKKTVGSLYKIPILGNSKQKLVENIDSSIAFSPDAGQFAFIRSITKEGTDQIIIANADGSGEKVLAERKKPAFFIVNTRESLAWSPDGKTIAVAAGTQDASSEQMNVVGIDVETGKERNLTTQTWTRVGKVVWSKDGNELYITAAETDVNAYQIVRLLSATGKAQQITNELRDYLTISLSNDGKTLLSVVRDDVSNIFTAPGENPGQTSQIATGNHDGTGGLAFTPDGKILYVSLASGNRDIYQMNADGTNNAPLSFDKATDEYPTISADGKYIVFVSNRTGSPHIWRMNSDGTQLQQLTDKSGESFPSVMSADNSVIYSVRLNQLPALWKVPIEGGTPKQITREQTHWAIVSPDGKLIACLALLEKEQNIIKPAIVSAATGDIIKIFEPVGTITSPAFPPTIRWTSDNQNIVYVSTVNGISNLWKQSIAGGDPKKITDFSTDRIYSFDFSANGRQIVYARGTSRNDIVLYEDFTN